MRGFCGLRSNWRAELYSCTIGKALVEFAAVGTAVAVGAGRSILTTSALIGGLFGVAALVSSEVWGAVILAGAGGAIQMAAFLLSMRAATDIVKGRPVARIGMRSLLFGREMVMVELRLFGAALATLIVVMPLLALLHDFIDIQAKPGKAHEDASVVGVYLVAAYLGVKFSIICVVPAWITEAAERTSLMEAYRRQKSWYKTASSFALIVGAPTAALSLCRAGIEDTGVLQVLGGHLPAGLQTAPKAILAWGIDGLLAAVAGVALCVVTDVFCGRDDRSG